jgi:hypothetical protein
MRFEVIQQKSSYFSSSRHFEPHSLTATEFYSAHLLRSALLVEYITTLVGTNYTSLLFNHGGHKQIDLQVPS